MSRSRLWLTGWLCALIVFAVPIVVAGAVKTDPPEIRVMRTGQNFSALIVTARHRILVINADDRGEARSSLGRFARPWEPDITTVLAPATDSAAIGLWEVLSGSQIQRALIVGTPGSDPIWTRIERECALRGIQLQYVVAPSEVDLAGAIVTIDPRTSSIAMRTAYASIAMALGDAIPGSPAHVAIVNAVPELPHPADVFVLAMRPETEVEATVVTVANREQLRLIFDERSIRVQGGTTINGVASSN